MDQEQYGIGVIICQLLAMVTIGKHIGIHWTIIIGTIVGLFVDTYIVWPLQRTYRKGDK